MRLGRAAFTVTALVAISAALPIAPASAQLGADLNISPKRVVFGQGSRSATVYIFNQGDKPATYAVEMVDRTMLANGEIVATDPAAPSAASARSLLEFTPHQITLQPKQSQSIRIRARRASAPGEYRSHLTVTAQPPEDVGFTAAQAASKSGGGALAMRIIALFSISIPVIVRDGVTDATAKIENASFVAAKQPHGLPQIALTIVRSGTGSVFGDIDVYAGQPRAERRVGTVRGVAVYPEVERRPFVVGLSQPVTPGERIRIAYRDDNAPPGTQLAGALLVTP